MKTDFTSWFFAKKKGSFIIFHFSNFPESLQKYSRWRMLLTRITKNPSKDFQFSNHRTNPSKLRTPSNGVNKKLARPREGNISKESEFSRGGKKGKTEYTRRPWSKRDDGVEYNTAVMRLSNAIFHSNVRVNALTMHPMHMTAWFSDKRALDGFNASGWKTL